MPRRLGGGGRSREADENGGRLCARLGVRSWEDRRRRVEEFDGGGRRSSTAGELAIGFARFFASFLLRRLYPTGLVMRTVGRKYFAAGPLASQSMFLRGGFIGSYKNPPCLQFDVKQPPYFLSTT